MNGPAKPVPTYEWEPTTDALAARYRLPRESIVRFDVNTSPAAPDLQDVLAGPFDPALGGVAARAHTALREGVRPATRPLVPRSFGPGSRGVAPGAGRGTRPAPPARGGGRLLRHRRIER